MIKCRWIAPCSMTFEGHAGYAEKGKDIVCAGVSTLWGTLIEELKSRELDGEGEISYKDGAISFKAKNEADIERVYAMVWRGILLLASKFGEYIDAERTW